MNEKPESYHASNKESEAFKISHNKEMIDALWDGNANYLDLILIHYMCLLKDHTVSHNYILLYINRSKFKNRGRVSLYF